MSSEHSVPWVSESSRLNEIGGGVALVAAAASLQVALSPLVPALLILFLAAVLVASRCWGRRAGLAATVASVAAAIAFMVQPGRGAAATELVPVGLLAIVGLGVAWWTGGRAPPGDHDTESRLKDEFLATVSHELRTPLNAILGWIQLLRLPRATSVPSELDPEITRGLEVIERNARRQLALVEDLLVAAGPARTPEVWQRVDLGEVVTELLHDLADTATAASVTWLPVSSGTSYHRVPAAAGPVAPAVCVLGDRAALRLALRHVLVNAIKFTPSGGRVRIDVERVGDRARVAVADTGDGIEPKLSQALFEPFRQRDGSASRTHGGLGLGLTVAQRLIEGHRGRIDIRSGGRGQGATVVLSLPAATAAPDAAAPQPAS